MIYLWIVTVFAAAWILRRSKRVRPDRESPARIHEILARAAYHREQLEAQATELREWHDFAKDSDAGDEIEAVIWDGVPYLDALTRISRWEQT